MMRFVWPTAFVAAAIVLSIWLVPTSWELAFMKLRDRDYPAAQAAFEERFARGEISREVAFPLSELYVRDGDVDKAIAVLLKYSATNPGDKDATKRLAELFREAQNLTAAIEQQERLAGENADPTTLRELDRLYDIADNEDGRAAALSRLVKSAKANLSEHSELAKLLAAKGKTDEALTVAYNALKRWPVSAPIDLLQLFTALSADAKRLDMFNSMLIPWSQKQASIANIEAIAGVLIDKEQNQAALSLVENSAAVKAGAPEGIGLLARLEAEHGDPKKAFALLKRIQSAGKMHASVDELFVDLAQRFDQSQLAFDHILARGPAAFGDAALVYSAVQAEQLGGHDFPQALEKKIKADKAHDRPLVLARIAYVRRDNGAALALARAAQAQVKDNRSKLMLAQLFIDLSEAGSARVLLLVAAALPDALSNEEISLGVPVAISVKESALSLKLAEILKARETSSIASILYARALTANGRGKQALEILGALKSPLDMAEGAELEALKATGQIDVLKARLIARLVAPNVSDAKRTNYVYALNDLKSELGAGAKIVIPLIVADLGKDGISGNAREARIELLSNADPAIAEPYLKAAAMEDPDRFGFSYVKLMKRLKRSHETHAFLLFAVQAAKDVKAQDGFLYELIKTGATADILPLLRDRANARGEEWFYAYDDALKSLGRRQERLEFLSAYGMRESIKPEMRRQIAFQILELGHKAAAHGIFFALAQNADPASPDVQQLLYLWGPRPEAESLKWLVGRADAAGFVQKVKWGQILANAGATDDAARVLRSAHQAGQADAIVPMAEALATLKQDAELRRLLDSALGASWKASELRQLAQAGESRGLHHSASLYYERAGQRDQRDGFAAAGRTALFAGERTRAKAMLERAIEQAPDMAETRFYMGETLRALKQDDAARAQYAKVVALTGNATKAEQRRLRMISQARLEQFMDAVASHEALRTTPGQGQEATIDYTSALLDQGEIERAGRALGY
jgi:hypothetical protein